MADTAVMILRAIVAKVAVAIATSTLGAAND
jgi:hypothetical protein